MQAQDNIDFSKIEWDKIEQDKLDFFFKEAVDYNDILINDIQNLNNKAFQLLTVAITAFSAVIGFLLAVWGEKGKEAISCSLLTACIGLGIILVLLLISVYPKTIYRGRATPDIIFADHPTWKPLYKAPLTKIMADGIASYNTYIKFNTNLMEFRGKFLIAGTIGFFIVPVITIIAFILFPQS